VLGVLLAAGNWYRQPERAGSWIAAMATFAVFALVWGCMTLVFRRWKNEAARHQAAGFIRSGIAFGGFIMVVSLGVNLAATLGTIDDPDRRGGVYVRCPGVNRHE